MGLPYEIASTPIVYAEKGTARLTAKPVDAVRVPYGPDSNQALLVYEPAQVLHDSCIVYFHGGGYLVGTPQSMGIAASVFNAWGYRFISMGFRLLSAARFPAQIVDAFAGVNAAIAYLQSHGVACDSLIVGGSSAGGLSAALLAYGKALQQRHSLDPRCIRGFIGMAPILDVDDLFIRPFPQAKMAKRFLDFPAADLSEAQAIHEALLPYSPIRLIGKGSDVPLFTLHGTHDSLSPYVTDVAFVDKLNETESDSFAMNQAADQPPEAAQTAGKPLATLHTLDGVRYQHIKLTAGIFSEDPARSEGLGALHDWLGTHAH